MIKKLFISLLLCLLPVSAFAEWKFNPYTGKLDYYDKNTMDLSGNTTDDLAEGTNKYANTTKEDNGQTAFEWGQKKGSIGFTITNGTSAMSTGWYCCAEAVNNFTATSWEVYSKDGTVGNITAVVKKADFGAGAGNYTESNFTACSGTENITLANTSFNEDTSLGSFNTTVVAGERFGLNVTAVNTVKGVDIIVKE